MSKTLYILEDGDRIFASSPKEFLTELHLGSWMDSEGTDEEYMVRFAERRKMRTGLDVRTDTAEHFYADLLEQGYMTPS